MNNGKCRTCRWWKEKEKPRGRVGKPDNYGFCHGAPPTAYRSGPGSYPGKFPMTKPDDWCGMHAPREVEPASDD